MRQVRLLRFGDMHRTRGSFHGGYTMKTKKKIALATLAAAMLAAASLGIFAYAHDVAPLYQVIAECTEPGCTLTAYEHVVETYELWDSHRVGNRDCHFDYKAYVCVTECARGHRSSTYERRLTKNHEFCGASDQY